MEIYQFNFNFSISLYEEIFIPNNFLEILCSYYYIIPIIFKFILIIFKYFRKYLKYLKMFQNQIFQVKCFNLEIFEIFQTCPVIK